MKKNVFHTAIILVGLFIVSCDSGDTLINEYHEISTEGWHLDSLATFEFSVEDTTAVYSLSYHVRYAAEYPYYNVYISYYLEDSTNEEMSSDLQNLLLFDKKTGTPLGDGVGDMFDRQIDVTDTLQFKSSGKYFFKTKQFMRMQTLPGIQSFGLKIEKNKQG